MGVQKLEKCQEAKVSGNTRRGEGHGRHAVQHFWVKEAQKCVCVSRSVMSYSFATPWTVACQAPLSMGFLRQEYWCELPFPPQGDLPDPQIQPELPELQVNSLPLSHQESATIVIVQYHSHVQLFVSPWTAAYEASLSLTIPQSLPKFMSITSVRQ